VPRPALFTPTEPLRLPSKVKLTPLLTTIRTALVAKVILFSIVLAPAVLVAIMLLVKVKALP